MKSDALLKLLVLAPTLLLFALVAAWRINEQAAVRAHVRALSGARCSSVFTAQHRGQRRGEGSRRVGVRERD
jgi:hypothetical protein